MKLLKGILCVAAFVPVVALASEDGPPLDKAPDLSKDNVALQRGAKMFVNNCLNCHGASYMRYNRLKDIGLTEEKIKAEYMYTAEKTGELMQVAINREDGKAWFGATPPDLTVIERARGADWLYTYLRSFYRDDSRPTGWNNLVFPAVGMPHVLWELQGENVLKVEKKGNVEHHSLVQAKPGKLKPAEYDAAVADLVAFLKFMGEPAANSRKSIGMFVLLALAVLGVLAYLLKKNYWKDIH